MIIASNNVIIMAKAEGICIITIQFNMCIRVSILVHNLNNAYMYSVGAVHRILCSIRKIFSFQIVNNNKKQIFRRLVSNFTTTVNMYYVPRDLGIYAICRSR